MERNTNITLNDCCTHYKVTSTFLYSLAEHDLLQIVQEEEEAYIMHEELNKLERYIYFHFDMDINLEGLEVIAALLDKLEQAQKEKLRLEYMLHQYGKRKKA